MWSRRATGGSRSWLDGCAKESQQRFDDMAGLNKQYTYVKCPGKVASLCLDGVEEDVVGFVGYPKIRNHWRPCTIVYVCETYSLSVSDRPAVSPIVRLMVTL